MYVGNCWLFYTEKRTFLASKRTAPPSYFRPYFRLKLFYCTHRRFKGKIPPGDSVSGLKNGGGRGEEGGEGRGVYGVTKPDKILHLNRRGSFNLIAKNRESTGGRVVQYEPANKKSSKNKNLSLNFLFIFEK